MHRVIIITDNKNTVSSGLLECLYDEAKREFSELITPIIENSRGYSSFIITPHDSGGYKYDLKLDNFLVLLSEKRIDWVELLYGSDLTVPIINNYNKRK